MQTATYFIGISDNSDFSGRKYTVNICRSLLTQFCDDCGSAPSCVSPVLGMPLKIDLQSKFIVIDKEWNSSMVKVDYEKFIFYNYKHRKYPHPTL